MSNTIGIALSGMTAETRRMDASASNLANARTRGPLAPSGNERARLQLGKLPIEHRRAHVR